MLFLLLSLAAWICPLLGKSPDLGMHPQILLQFPPRDYVFRNSSDVIVAFVVVNFDMPRGAPPPPFIHLTKVEGVVHILINQKFAGNLSLDKRDEEGNRRFHLQVDPPPPPPHSPIRFLGSKMVISSSTSSSSTPTASLSAPPKLFHFTSTK
jgi:hypothetical protein